MSSDTPCKVHKTFRINDFILIWDLSEWTVVLHLPIHTPSPLTFYLLIFSDNVIPITLLHPGFFILPLTPLYIGINRRFERSKLLIVTTRSLLSNNKLRIVPIFDVWNPWLTKVNPDFMDITYWTISKIFTLYKYYKNTSNSSLSGEFYEPRDTTSFLFDKLPY